MKRMTSYLTAAALPLTILAGACIQPATPGGSGGAGTTPTTEELTRAEEAAVAALLTSTETLASAVTTTQGATSGTDSATQSSLDAGPSGAACPAVTFNASTGGGSLSLSASIDFGNGCDLYGNAGYMCSGGASGTYSQANQTLSMRFDSISCSGRTLGGDLNVVFSRTTSTVGFAGAFDLDYTNSGKTVEIEGNGSAQFNRSSYSTSIPTFQGELFDGSATHQVALAEVELSYFQYGNFVPFAGQATLVGDSIRTIVVHFDADSPVTGTVQVEIGGADPISVNVFEF